MISIIFNLLLLGLVTGISTYAIAVTITSESGPFHIFDRLRFALLPAHYKVTFETNNSLIDFTNPKTIRLDSENQPLDFAIDVGDYNLNKMYSEMLLPYDDLFNRSLRGTLYNILNCKYCNGTWAALFSALVLSFIFFYSNPFIAGIALILWLNGITWQRAIIRVLEGKEDDIEGGCDDS